MSKKTDLWKEVEKFIDEHDICSSETVYQSDHIIENAYEFMDKIFTIVGYKSDVEDEID